MYNASSVILASLYLIKLEVFLFAAISYYRAIVMTSLFICSALVPSTGRLGMRLNV